MLDALAAPALVCSTLTAQTPEAGEQAIKAAFLYNFTKFVNWPASAFEDERSPIRVCLAGEGPFHREIDAMVVGESVGGRPLEVHIADPTSARRCHVIYFGAGDAARAQRLLAMLKGAPVLIVGEGPAFLSRGGHIAFVREDDRVRFDVNKTGADGAGLTISSKLLRVARRVEMDAGASLP
jgi:hypothetical protein